MVSDFFLSVFISVCASSSTGKSLLFSTSSQKLLGLQLYWTKNKTVRDLKIDLWIPYFNFPGSQFFFNFFSETTKLTCLWNQKKNHEGIKNWFLNSYLHLPGWHLSFPIMNFLKNWIFIYIFYLMICINLHYD